MTTIRKNTFVRVFVVSENSYLFLGVKALVDDICFFKGCICTVVQVGNLPELMVSSKSKSYDIVISDNYFHRYLISQDPVRNTVILPAHYDLETYIQCFNNMKDISCTLTSTTLKKLSMRENLLYAFFSAGIHDDGIAAILQISKKTISAHRRNILEKLSLKNRNELYIYALATRGEDA